jgi:hypothetical protein
MLYEVGTYIDLRHVGRRKIVEKKPSPLEPTEPAEYAVGTRIIFLNFKSSLEILNVRSVRA